MDSEGKGEMMLRKNLIFSLLAGVVGLVLSLAAPVAADTIFQSQTYATQSVPFTQNIIYSRFNPALGTLLSIQVGGSTNVTAEVDIFNNTASIQTFTNAQATVPIDISTNYGLLTSVTATAGPFAGSINPGLNAFAGITSSTPFPTFNIAPADFSNFIQGPANTTVNLSATSSGGSFTGNSSALGSVFFGGSATAGGTLTLTYVYALVNAPPAPLPTVLPAGLGLLGLMGLAKVRKHRAGRVTS